MILTKAQLDREVTITVQVLKELLAMPEVKDLLGKIRLVSKPYGDFSGDVLYLTPNGLVYYHWNRVSDMFDESSVDGSERLVTQEQLPDIVKGFGLTVGLLKNIQRELRS